MRNLGARLLRAYRRLPPYALPLVVIVLGVLLGNIMYVSGLANNDPISWTAGISHKLCRVTCGRPMIDPNVGFLTQPLGHLAAMDLLHGHLPWWNYFEGLGQPLAGEMQGASLFPLTLLFAMPAGLLFFHLALEIIAGVSTYFLARRLAIASPIATGVGILFALNGTFAWLGNAVLNPVCFLPMLLLGVEVIYADVEKISKKGWIIVALALALSLYAGFPEVAYLDGLMAVGWTVVRFFSLDKSHRLSAARRVGLGAFTGVLLALPILVAFLDFMKVANVGGHLAVVEGVNNLSSTALPMYVDPYVYGTLFSNPNAVFAWGGIGGYFLAGVSALALLGLFGAKYRALRIFLGAWILVGMLGTFNTWHARVIWNLIPLVKTMALPRYVTPSLEMAAVVLAALGITDFATERRAKWLFSVTTLAALGLTIQAALSARALNRGVVLSSHKAEVILIGLDALPFIALGLLVVLGRFHRYKVTPILVTIVLVGESIIMFFVPSAEAPKQITVDQAPIAFLQANQGQQRFLDFAVLYPNWGSQYNINSLSAIDLPFPTDFANFITSKLFPSLSPPNQFVIHSGMAGIVAQEQAVVAHFTEYQNASVKYLLFPNQVIISPALTKLGVKRVFEDALAAIYEMPAPRPFFSTSSTACTVTSSSVNVAHVSCPKGPATLVRTELMMAGWRAYVNGRVVPMAATEGVYQTIDVPAGSSTVTYSFLPPHEKFAGLGAFAGVLIIAGSFAWQWRRRRRSAHRED